MRMIYLDNAATTQVYPSAAEAAFRAMTTLYANPASLHHFGIEAEKVLEQSRAIIAAAAGVKKEELYFTAGGTGSSNTAIFGTLAPLRGGRIICSAYEHPAVLACFKQLQTKFDVVYVKPSKRGIIEPDDLFSVLTPDTRLVSIMHVNNETGAVNPIRDLAKITKTVSKNALFHTDAVQAFLKESFSYACVDMASFSAHKTHAPKGIGALYVKKDVSIKPVIFGGGQERGLFSGTSNVPGAAAWADAVQHTAVTQNHKTVAEVNHFCRKAITELGAEIISPSDASVYILNAAFNGYMAENLLHALASEDIYVSTGSACSSRHGSHVFGALDMTDKQKSALRISFSAQNTLQEIQIFQHKLARVLNRVAKKS